MAHLENIDAERGSTCLKADGPHAQARAFDPAMSELDYVLEGFYALFEAWRGKRIVLHGTREYAQAIIEAFDGAFHFLAVATDEEAADEFAGKPVWSDAQLFSEQPDLVILTERVRHAEKAYRSLQAECRVRGIALFDMYGLNWLDTMDDVESQTSQTLNGWIDITGAYDIVSFELPDCVLVADPSSEDGGLTPRVQTKRLIDRLASQGKQVLFIGRGPYTSEQQLDALRAFGLVPDGEDAAEAFFMRAGEDGTWRTIRAKHPYERILHIGYGIPKECILPRYYGVDTYRMVFSGLPQMRSGKAFDGLIAQALDPDKLQTAIEEAIASADVVSFDVFDTLIMRTVLRPHDVFELAEQRAITEGIPARGFARARIAAQSAQGMSDIYGIYRAIQKDLALSDVQRDRLLDMELEVENDVTVPRESILRVLQAAIEVGKRVILTSDMYFPEPALEKLIESKGINGYGKLLVSCDVGRLKRQGLLSRLLEAGINAKQIVHIGNSLVDDIEPADALGIRTVLVPSAFDLALAYGLGKQIEGASGLDARCDLGALIATRFRDPFAKHAIDVVSGRPCSGIDVEGIAHVGGSFNPPSAFAERNIAHVAAPLERMPHELRQALLRWYPFEHGERALFLGADRDALLPLLRPHYARVDTELVPDVRYDAIVLLDPLEPKAPLRALADRLSNALSPNGTLLVGYRNRFGLKYLCGGIDDVVRVPFSSLDDADASLSLDSAPLYSEGEMRRLFEDAGFTCDRSYGVLPDQHFAQAIYTEDYLPPSGIRDRVFPYDAFSSPLVAAQSDLYDATAQSGMLVHTANYLLVECRKAAAGESDAIVAGTSQAARVAHVALSLDRGMEHSFITSLLTDGTVVKSPAHPEGFAALERAYDNGEKLRSRGLSVVEQQLLPDGLHMPLVTEQPLLAYLESLLPDDAADFAAVFDLLYADILRSSDQVEISDDDALSQWGVPAAQLGSVLRAGFIDMVPYNAFWHDGKLLFFDQEFVREDCPAKYILFRALHYTWIHLPQAEQAVGLARLRRRYGLDALWEAFSRAENEFIAGNRKTDAYRDVYKWAEVDRDAIAQRRLTLLGKREDCEETPSDTIPEGTSPVLHNGKPYRVGLLMGVFDLFHVGHLRLIKRAKERCGYLRVGVLSDELVEHFKNVTPTIPQAQRMEIVGAIAGVDEVVPIDDTPSRIVEWNRRRFDCFFSGDDYADDEYWMQEKTELERLGATIEFFPYTEEQSSTRIRKQLG